LKNLQNKAMTQQKPIYKAFATAQSNYFEEAQKGFITITGLMKHGSGYAPYVRLNEQPSEERIRIMKDWRRSILDIGGKPQHLYIKDEEARIEVGDVFTNIHSEIQRATEDTDWIEEVNELPMKLIASTDSSLGLPMVSEGFIVYFVSIDGEMDDREIDVYIEGGIARVNVLRLEADDAEANPKAGFSTHPLERDSLNGKVNERAKSLASKWALDNADETMATNSALNRGYVAGWLARHHEIWGDNEAEQFNLIVKILEDYKAHMECHISQYCDKDEIIEPADFLKPYN
jgi:hypothetical protein